jgi:hypothetical protein
LAWLNDWVITLNLCPFAAKVVNDKTLRIAVCDSDDEQQMVRQILQELDHLVQESEDNLSTSLLVFTHGLKDFDSYLDFADWANDLLVEAGLEGNIQIATFHPQYQFEGAEVDDVTNYSNRSPYPTLHFIREQQLEAAVANYPNPEAIPENNINKLKALGLPKVLQMLSGEA